MKRLNIANTGLAASRIALGCMRISDLQPQSAQKLLGTALEQGINFFDHADIYGAGRSEKMFAKAIEGLASRDEILLQSKCGIDRGLYDASKEHILSAVDGILSRLKTDYLDVLLLHRPDALLEPEEVAEAFEILHRAGKVRYFGVSNQNTMQIQLLQKYCGHKLVINQLQFSIPHACMVTSGTNVNLANSEGINRDGSVLDYCRLNEITIQPWSPFQYGFFEGVFIGSQKFPELNRVLEELGEKYGISASAMALAWILRHPAKMQPIVGTTNPERLEELCLADGVCLSRDDWYTIYKAAGHFLP